MEKVIVTGGNGKLGRYVVRALSRCHHVHVVDLAQPPENVRGSYSRINILDLDAVRRVVRGCDAIVHLAARDLSVGGPDEKFIKTNVQGTWNVCAAAVEAGVSSLVFCSSVAVYGLYDTKDIKPQYFPVDEEHPIAPARAYGVSKALGESITQAATRRGLDVICLRLPLVAFSTEIDSIIRNAINPSVGQLFCYVAPEDAARAFSRALSQPLSGWHSYNISADDSYFDGDTLRAMYNLYGVLPPIRSPEQFARDYRRSVLDASKARQELEFIPKLTWPDLVAMFEREKVQ